MPLLQQIYCQQNNTCFSIPLEKRKVIKKTLNQFIGLFFTLIVIIFFLIGPAINMATDIIENGNVGQYYFSNGLFLIVISLLVAGMFCVPIFYQCLYYRYYFYDLRNEDIVIKKGVVSRGEITLPYSKIQNVFVDQDFWDRIFGIYDVHIETAGFGSGMAAHIDGVNYKNSEKLRDIIMAKVKSQGPGDKSF